MDATSFFLTYSHSDTWDAAAFELDKVYDFLKSIKPVVWARVAIEPHANGTPHCHAVVRYGARVKTRSDNRLFDYGGIHPNITIPRNIKNVLQYHIKGSMYKDYGEVPGTTSIFDEMQTAAASLDRDALDRCALENRVSKQWADHLWARHAVRDANTILDAGAGTMCLQLQGLLFTGGSVAVIGPSGCGKTTWAKLVCPKPGLWVRHIDDLRKLGPQHKSIIFDDMDFTHWPRTSQIHLVDQHDSSSINVRYGTVTLPAGMPRIFTGNTHMFTSDPAIDRRIMVTMIYSYTL